MLTHTKGLTHLLKRTEKGRIKEGYLADFVILDQDIFTCEHTEIKNIRVDATYIPMVSASIN